jgi:hypothetical protein
MSATCKKKRLREIFVRHFWPENQINVKNQALIGLRLRANKLCGKLDMSPNVTLFIFLHSIVGIRIVNSLKLFLKEHNLKALITTKFHSLLF